MTAKTQNRAVLSKLAHEIGVMNYADYRDFLGDLYKAARQKIEPYSYLLFASDLGFAAGNMIRLIIARKRVLADASALTIVRSLKLRKQQRKYFLAMVRLVNAGDASHDKAYFKQMLAAKQATISSGKERNIMEYHSEWYYPVVRELLRVDGINREPQELAASLLPDVSPEKVRSALALLENIGLITIDPKTGAVTKVDDRPLYLPSDTVAGYLSIRRYHQALMDVSREVLTKIPDDDLEMNALTLSLSRKSFEQLKTMIRDFCASVMAVEGQEATRDCVAQMNLQLFTLSKPSVRR